MHHLWGSQQILLEDLAGQARTRWLPSPTTKQGRQQGRKHGSDHEASREVGGRLADLKPTPARRRGEGSADRGTTSAPHVYLTATLDAVIWGAELAAGQGPGRIYRVEPTGPIEDDPNLTDK